MAKPQMSDMSINDLQREIARRERKLRTLQRRRAKIVEQLEEIDREIIAEGGTVIPSGGVVASPTGGRKRHRNDSNLIEALIELLTGTEMSVTEAATAVQEAGYKTTSPNFRTIVNQALLRDGRFKKISRGRYTADPKAPAAKKKTTKKRSTKKTTKKRSARTKR